MLKIGQNLTRMGLVYLYVMTNVCNIWSHFFERTNCPIVHIACVFRKGRKKSINHPPTPCVDILQAYRLEVSKFIWSLSMVKGSSESLYGCM